MNIALVAHDARKQELVDWCTHNALWLSKHKLYGTGTTARLLSEIQVEVKTTNSESNTVDSGCCTTPLVINPLLSGPLGGDQQIGAMIATGQIDMLIFFCDNLVTQGHQQDVGALVRLASLYNIAFATNRTTADMLITSTLMNSCEYTRQLPGCIENYKKRSLK